MLIWVDWTHIHSSYYQRTNLLLKKPKTCQEIAAKLQICPTTVDFITEPYFCNKGSVFPLAWCTVQDWRKGQKSQSKIIEWSSLYKSGGRKYFELLPTTIFGLLELEWHFFCNSFNFFKEAWRGAIGLIYDLRPFYGLILEYVLKSCW